MGGAVGLWVAAEWRRRWPALIGLAVLVALAGGAATALAAGARRADTAYTRFRDATGEPNLVAQVDPRRGRADRGRHRRRPLRRPRRGDRRARRAGGRRVGRGRVVVGDRHVPGGGPRRAGHGVRHRHVRHGRRAAATPIVVDGHLPGVDDPRRRHDQRGGRPGAGPRRRQHADVRHGLAGPSPGVGEQRRAVRLRRGPRRPDDRGPRRRRRPIRGATSRPRSPRSSSPRASPAPTATRSPTSRRSSRVRADPERLDAVAADMEAVLAPYGLEMTATEAPGAAILPSVEVGVTTLWIAAAVTAAGGLLLVGQALGRLVAASATDRPALAAMGMTRPQQALGSICGGDRRHRRRRAWPSRWSPGRRVRCSHGVPQPSPNLIRACAGMARCSLPVRSSRSSPRAPWSPSSLRRCRAGGRRRRQPAVR